MKIKITPFQRKGLALFCLALSSLLLINCSSKDLESIDPYEFINTDFTGIGDLPAVVDEDMEITEPVTGRVANSPKTQGIVQDVLGTGEDGEIPAETVAALEEVEEFMQQFPTAVNEAAQSLTLSDVDAILDPNQELDTSLEELRAGLQDIPAEIAQLLPTIEFDVEVPGTNAMANFNKSPLLIGDRDILSQTVSGPCADAAYDAYNIKMEDLHAQRDENLSVLEANYARRIEEADARYLARLELHEENLVENTGDIKGVIEDLLNAADHAESTGDLEVAENLRLLALIYAVDAGDTLEEWNTLVLELLEEAMLEEKTWAEERVVTRRAEVLAAFNSLKAEADALLSEALNDCHNQGSGN